MLRQACSLSCKGDLLFPLPGAKVLPYPSGKVGGWFFIFTLSSVQLLSLVQLFATPWTTAHQASLSRASHQLAELAETHVHQVSDAI